MMCDDIRLFLLVIIILATDVNHRSLSLNLIINMTVARLISTLILTCVSVLFSNFIFGVLMFILIDFIKKLMFIG